MREVWQSRRAGQREDAHGLNLALNQLSTGADSGLRFIHLFVKTLRRNLRSNATFRFIQLLSLALVAILSVGDVSARPQKLRVTDPAAAAELKAHGARVIADYGSFQLLEMDAPSPSALRQSKAESADESDFIELNAGHLDTRAAEIVAMRKTVGGFGGRKFHLVHFVGPIKPEWLAELEATGVKIVHYIPQNAYLVHGDAAALAKLQNWSRTAAYVQWEGDYADSYKIHPRSRTTDAKGNTVTPPTDSFTVQLVEDADANPITLALIDQIKLAPVQQQFSALNYLNVIVRITPGRLAELSARPDVVSIHPHFERHRMDERQGQVMAGNLTGNSPSGPGYLSWLASKGFTQAQFIASGFVVDVTDSGIDNGSAAPGHFGLYQNGDPGQNSRVVYNRLEGTPNAGSTLQGCDGHGNLNSHIIAGFNDMSTSPHLDSSGFHYGLGICPFVKVGSSVIFDTDNFTSPNYNNLQSRAYRDGARVSNNSWGADTAGAYDVDAQNYDALVRDAQPSGSSVPNLGNQQMVICFAAGNAGPNATTVGSPGTAKNVIVVGAAENVHSHSTANGGNSATGSDGCSTLDTEANSAADIASFSSRGPCADGRQKPDLVAPGTHITGGVGQSVLTTNGTGSAISCFKATGVCGLPGGGTVGNANNFFPLGQQFYSTSSGTSHSTPGVVGACALLRQYFINASLTPPSPAMTKAFLVNAARYMTGTSANDNLPSPNQGMGSVNLGTAFDGVARVLRDQVGADKFTATGQARTINGTIADNTKPFRVALAWTDAPGNTTGNSYNNNLDLSVTVGGNTYKGNVFSGGNSVTGGTADPRNNLESVFIPAGVSGAFVVTVTAANIASDGVPNEAPTLDQDYALVIYNANDTPTPVISTGGYALTFESCVAPNGVVDANETVTINFVLRNVGTANTTNLIATLLATNGITSPSGAQTYGALIAGGSSVTQAVSFTASVACGSNLVARFALTDGAANLGEVTLAIQIGQLAPVFTENFDSLATPAFSSGWTTSAGGAQSPWTTTTIANDTAPNAAFSPAPAATGSNQLVSTTFLISSASSQLSFRHRYELEPTFDGGVLEIKIGAGAFADILTAGGSFASGGYSGTIGSGNALGARSAWTGTNAAFSTVLVNLPVAVVGQNVQFRWRCGTDSSISRAGWWVDSIAVTGPVCCGDIFPPIITTQPQSETVPLGNPATFNLGAVGENPLSYQWYLNASAISGATNSSYSIAITTTNDAGSYQVIVTNISGSATSSVATLTLITAPIITAQPASLTVSTGSTAGFSVTAIGAPPLSYQWRFNGTDILDATNVIYAMNAVTTNDVGSYVVVVTNAYGSITSAPAILTVNSGTAANIVISQIYGGGGNSGATYRNDYVELFNPGGVAASVSGWSLQYASATGTGWAVANLNGSIPAGAYYLVQLASGGAIGLSLPTANATNTAINISGSNGKLALVTNQVALTGANPVGGLTIADFVGYGTAGAFEGTAAAPAGGNSTAIFRKNNGMTDTGDNAADFQTGSPNPRNSAPTNPPPAGMIDLAVTKSHVGTFTQGDTSRTYTIIVTNVGSLSTTGLVSVVDALPTGLTAIAMTGTGWSITLGTLTATRGDALVTNSAYPAITLTVNVATNATASLTNAVTVSTGGDMNTINNTASDTTSITQTNGGAGGTGNYTGVLIGWNVSGQTAYGPSPFLPTTNAPNVTVVGLTRATGVTTSGSGSAASRAWGGNGFDATTAAAAITANNFVTCGLMANAGYKISFTAIDKYDARRSDNSATNSIIQYQVGSGGFVTIATNTHPTGGGGFSLGPISLSSITALQNVGPGTNITFRIVPYNTSNAGGNWYLYDVANSTALDFSITGTIAPLSGPPATAPTLTLFSVVSNQFQFTLTGTTSSNYVIEVSTNLNSGTWLPVSTGAAPILFTEPSTNDQRYYRGRISP